MASDEWTEHTQILGKLRGMLALLNPAQSPLSPEAKSALDAGLASGKKSIDAKKQGRCNSPGLRRSGNRTVVLKCMLFPHNSGPHYCGGYEWASGLPGGKEDKVSPTPFYKKHGPYIPPAAPETPPKAPAPPRNALVKVAPVPVLPKPKRKNVARNSAEPRMLALLENSADPLTYAQMAALLYKEVKHSTLTNVQGLARRLFTKKLVIKCMTESGLVAYKIAPNAEVTK